MIKKIFFKFACAFTGVGLALKQDASIRLQILLAAITVVVFAFMGLDTFEWLFIISAIFTVLITEFINSTFERFCDLITSRYDLVVKDVKDLGAGAVLLASVYALIVGLTIIMRRIL